MPKAHRTIRRRNLIAMIGGATVARSAWPLRASAQQSAVPIIGFLHSGVPEENVDRLAAYRKGLSEAGFVEGQNVAIEFRWAAGHDDKLPALAAELVQRQVAVISTAGSTPAAIAAKAATATIPIVFATGADPVKLGLVASLSRPGGNATGGTSLNPELGAKRLGLLHDLMPQAARYLALVNPTSTMAEPFVTGLQAGAATLGVHVDLLNASTTAGIDAAFASIPPQPGTVLLVSTDVYFFNYRAQIIALATRHAWPAIYDNREYAADGGLISYGADFLNLMELAGSYTGRILKGAKPADLPVLQSAKFQLVINLRTAKALGLTVPQLLLAQADEVIE